MGKIIQLKEENIIPNSTSKTPVYPATISKAAKTHYSEQYPGTPEIKGDQYIDVETDLKNLWLVLGNTAVKPQTLVTLPYDGNAHDLSAPSTARYTLTKQYVGEAKEVGTYKYLAQLKTGYTWRDLTTDPVEVILSIYSVKKALTTAIATPKESLVYKIDTEQELVTKNYPTDYTGTVTFTIGGVSYETPKATNAATYKIHVSATDDTNYIGIEYDIEATISKMTVAYPQVITSYGYNKSEQVVKYTNGSAVADTAYLHVVDGSTLKATNAGSYKVFFEPKDTANMQWASKDTQVYTVAWAIVGIPLQLTWSTASSYTVGDTMAVPATADVELNFKLYFQGSYKKNIEFPHLWTIDEIGSGYYLMAEFAGEHPNYTSIYNPVCDSFSVSAKTNVITWDPDQVISCLVGNSVTLKASVNSGHILFRKNTKTGDTIGEATTKVGDYYVFNWTPDTAGTFKVYATNIDYDATYYKQATAKALSFVITVKPANRITWSGETYEKYVGDTISLPSDAVVNDYDPTAEAGTVLYFKGDYSSYPDGQLPSVSPLSSPYSITASDITGLIITAFNRGYDPNKTAEAPRVAKSIKVVNKTGDIVSTTPSSTAYVDTTWTWEVEIPSGTIDFQLKTTDGWSSVLGDSRATITPLTSTKYRLEYKFIGPSGRIAYMRVHNTPAAGWAEPSNNDLQVSVGIISKTNVITQTTPTDPEISVTLGDTINVSAYATSGYVYFYNGNPDDTVNPGTLITEGYVSGNSGEPCSISNYAITKATTLIYMVNVGADGAYATATSKILKVYATELIPLTIKFDGGSTGTFKVGTPVTYNAKVYKEDGTEVPGFTFKYFIGDTEYESGTYMPTSTETEITVKAVCQNPSAISGYIVTPTSQLKVFTKEEISARLWYSDTFGELPTTDAQCETAMTITNGQTINTETALASPKTLALIITKGYKVSCKNSLGDECITIDYTATGITKYDVRYLQTRAGYKSVLTFTITKL